jgi:hypothetical protein
MRLRITSVLFGCLLLAGCSHAPAFDLFGSFFPVWIFCILIGIVGAVVSRFVLRRIGDGVDYGPPVLIYPSLVIFFACVSWLLFFR